MRSRRVSEVISSLAGLLACPCSGGDTALQDQLKAHVKVLSEQIGPRGVFRPAAYAQAARYLQDEFRSMGYVPLERAYTLGNVSCANIEIEVAGGTLASEILVIGAHYDSVPDCPAANDNGSGVAGMLALARRLKDSKPGRTLRFVAFANEEPPYFQSPQMGSMVYASGSRKRGEKIVGMVSLETIGYYTDAPNSQHYPEPLGRLYPSVGNYIGFVANLQSAALLQHFLNAFRQHSQLPCQGAAVTDMAPGIGWSDHWSFWQAGYPALMVTDTAPFRYPHYHKPTDTWDRLDYRRMAQVVEGVAAAITHLADAGIDPTTAPTTPPR